MRSTATLFWRLLALLLAMLLLPGCASLMADRDPPAVSVENIRSLPSSEGGGPRFEIVLRVANPNKEALDIVGISYNIDILDHTLVTGVTNEVPRIDAYSEQTVTLEAGVNLFQLLRLLGDLGQAPSEALDYRFEAKIDFKGLVPTQRVTETGSLALN